MVCPSFILANLGTDWAQHASDKNLQCVVLGMAKTQKGGLDTYRPSLNNIPETLILSACLKIYLTSNTALLCWDHAPQTVHRKAFRASYG